jgi:ribosomal protein L11 methyltransferase
VTIPLIQPWQVAFEVLAAHAFSMGEALDPHVDSCATFEMEGSSNWAITGIVQHFPDHAAIIGAIEAASEAAGIRMPEVVIEQLPPIDWLARNRESFPSMRYGRFLIHGSHQRPVVRTNALTIEVDAGRAFGSGTHGTTEGCLRALDRLHRSTRPRRMLDLGCGSGILAMAAARLWPGLSILAVDIDIQAVHTTRENIRLNQVTRQIRVARADGYPKRRGSVGGRCDLVTANILAGPLIKMAPDAAHWIRLGGRIILSGLLNHQEREVLAAYRACGFELIHRGRIQGWSTLGLRRRLKRRSATRGPPILRNAK